MNSKIDVTVILTAFKRVDSLRKQLEAINNQTLLPKKIVLFQDRIKDDYTIVIRDELLELFDDVKIAAENAGVWGRFDYARQADTKYVCIFDDDTIPGTKWLENCYYQMSKNEGIYGTIGIILDENNNYPWNKYCRIGWDRPNEQAKEVDFVGHSWFIKTEWLRYMFEGTEKYQEFKYAAEDMTLSFACLKHGIHTYVPPHPMNNIDLWGSMPDIAMGLGTSNVALSKSNNNVVMNKAVIQLINDGWKPLYIRERSYARTAMKSEARFVKRARIKKLFKIVRSQLKIYKESLVL